MVSSLKNSIRSLLKRFGFSKLRQDWQSLLRRLRQPKFKTEANHKIKDYLHNCKKTGAPPLLHVGAGENKIEGWLNTDLEAFSGAVFLDIGKPWPIPSNCLAAIHAEHVIEHIERNQAKVFLRESLRCLRLGGRLRIVTPDLTFLAKILLAEELNDIEKRIINRHKEIFRVDKECSVCDYVNDMVRMWGHKYLWTEYELKNEIIKAGFLTVLKASSKKSSDPLLQGVDSHAFESQASDIANIFLEAIK